MVYGFHFPVPLSKSILAEWPLFVAVPVVSRSGWPGACSANVQVFRILVSVYARLPVVLLYKLYDIFLIMSIGRRKKSGKFVYLAEKKRGNVSFVLI